MLQHHPGNDVVGASEYAYAKSSSGKGLDRLALGLLNQRVRRAIDKTRHYLDRNSSHGGADHGAEYHRVIDLAVDQGRHSNVKVHPDNFRVQPFFFKEAFFSGHSGSQ